MVDTALKKIGLWKNGNQQMSSKDFVENFFGEDRFDQISEIFVPLCMFLLQLDLIVFAFDSDRMAAEEMADEIQASAD